MALRGRQDYNPIASNDSDDFQDEELTSSDVGVQETSRPRRTGNSEYSRLTGNAADGNDQVAIRSTKSDVDNSADTDLPATSTASLVDSMDEDDTATECDADEDSAEKFNVVVLDSAQKRFSISVREDWTVKKFKKVGYKIHKVPSAAQRLIFRGKMLQDVKTLREMGITEENVIIHLFPKPRVVVTSSSNTDTASVTSSPPDDEGGAHIPQIVLDEEEQERRGQILVLGSYEIAEAQNNVRLLALLLGTISFMRLLALFSLATGADADDSYNNGFNPAAGHNSTDDTVGPSDDNEQRTWGGEDTFDLIVSIICFFVARLGMKATYENTSRLAMQYLTGTAVAGILWNIWNISVFVTFAKEESQEPDDDGTVPLSEDDMRTIAIFTVLLPLGVWILCCSRAWQFLQLIREAEREASERIRTDLTLAEGDDDDDDERNADIETNSDRPAIV